MTLSSNTLMTRPLCMENRMLAAEATGVATYARTLRTAQQVLSPRALLLGGGRASAPGSPATRAERWRRMMHAALPAGVQVQATPAGFERHDLFRVDQAFFTLYGRLLPVRVHGPAGIMYWSYPVPLRVAGWRNLYTVHDAIPLIHPELSPIEPMRHRQLLLRIATRADAIVTVSAAAAEEIATALFLPPGRVVNCSQPIAVADPGNVPLPAGLVAGRYLLVCGSVEPRKNIARIVAAYRASGTALPLVVAGPDGWRGETVAAMLAGTPGIVRLPWQSRETMVTLLARALVMPSLAEGFGLPVAEAMALGDAGGDERDGRAGGDRRRRSTAGRSAKHRRDHRRDHPRGAGGCTVPRACVRRARARQVLRGSYIHRQTEPAVRHSRKIKVE